MVLMRTVTAPMNTFKILGLPSQEVIGRGCGHKSPLDERRPKDPDGMIFADVHSVQIKARTRGTRLRAGTEPDYFLATLTRETTSLSLN